MLCQDIQRPNASWLEDLGTTESVCPCRGPCRGRVVISGCYIILREHQLRGRAVVGVTG